MAPPITRVSRLNHEQIQQFKRDGYLVLPAVLDQDLCRQARDDMWEAIDEHLPRMKRHDPATWTHITDEESARFKDNRPEGGGDPYFNGGGARFYVRNGVSETLLDLGPRAMWDVAEQLLGEGTLVWPHGLDDDGLATGSSFMSDDAVNSLTTNVGHDMGWPEKGTFTTEMALRLPPTGPVWTNGQGTRGLYCTLPASPDPSPDYTGAHSDGAVYGRYRLQMAAYIDEVPPACGGFTVWPSSHIPIWASQWKAFRDGEKHTDKHLAARQAGGYTDPVILQIKRESSPVDCHGPAGTVVLWHTKLLHVVGQNASRDVIRQATIYGYMKNPESVPDALAMDSRGGDIWRDLSDELNN